MKRFVFLLILFLSTSYQLSCLSKETKGKDENKGYYLQLGIGYRSPKWSKLRFGVPTYEDGSWNSGNNARIIRLDEGFDKDIGIGYRFNKKYRISINYKNYYHPVSEWDRYATGPGVDGKYLNYPELKVDAYTINIFRDFAFKNSKFSPYIGAGVGMTNTHNSDFGPYRYTGGNNTFTSSYRASNSSSLYNELNAGISYKIDKKYTLYIQSAYSGVGDHKIMHSSGQQRIQIQNSKTLTFLSGIRINF
tara:strand:- start:172 stop:915 length:744 start_codon:yes stop_codon:yes gene_type:complete